MGRQTIGAVVCTCLILACMLSEHASAVPPKRLYNLLGPAKPVGSKLREDMTLTFTPTNAPVSLRIQYISSESIHILGTNKRQLTKYKRHIAQDKTITTTTQNGVPQTSIERGALSGTTILHTLRHNNWSQQMLGQVASHQQRKEMNKLTPPEPDAPYYPRTPVGIGHTWSVKASQMQGLFGGSIQSLRGTFHMRLVRITKHRGLDCAQIRVTGTVRGMAGQTSGTPMTVFLSLKGSFYRSLAYGDDVGGHFAGKMGYNGTRRENGRVVPFSLNGPYRVTVATSIIKTGR